MQLEWTQIIITAITVIIGDVLIRLLFFKQDKKAKNVQNVDAEVAVAQHANEMLSQQLERSHETIARKDEQINKQQDEIASLKAAQSCLFDDMCIHKGCRVRKPHQGQGSQWYEKYREDPNLGADYISIDTLVKQDRAKRLKMEKEAEAEVVVLQEPTKLKDGWQSSEEAKVGPKEEEIKDKKEIT
jgi:GTPase